MTIAEIIEFYREQNRQALLAAWGKLRETSFRTEKYVRHFDPHLWMLHHDRVTASSARRDALALWCHQNCTARWMFNELPTGDMYLFEQRADAERFRAEVRGPAPE